MSDDKFENEVKWRLDKINSDLYQKERAKENEKFYEDGRKNHERWNAEAEQRRESKKNSWWNSSTSEATQASYNAAMTERAANEMAKKEAEKIKIAAMSSDERTLYLAKKRSNVFNGFAIFTTLVAILFIALAWGVNEFNELGHNVMTVVPIVFASITLLLYIIGLSTKSFRLKRIAFAVIMVLLSIGIIIAAVIWFNGFVPTPTP
ncbi:MAG: hypothetical protein FWE03_00855 [Firmicutes bacterium]|nr:hypothetical protein [Bacillota bacterium]